MFYEGSLHYRRVSSIVMIAELLSIVLLVAISVVVSALPASTIQNVQLRQQKLCQLDDGCNNCSLRVEEQLLIEKDEWLRGKIEIIGAHNRPLTAIEQQQMTYELNDAERQCVTPQYRGNSQQYCCRLWIAFDCLTRIATERCTFLNFIKYRKNLIQWSNDLMLLNVCNDFDYSSKKCREPLPNESGDDTPVNIELFQHPLNQQQPNLISNDG